MSSTEVFIRNFSYFVPNCKKIQSIVLSSSEKGFTTPIAMDRNVAEPYRVTGGFNIKQLMLN